MTDQLDLLTTAPYLPYGRTTTSAEAAESIRDILPRLEMVVLTAIRRRARTSAELESALLLPHQTVSARIRGLALRGLIEDSGERRKTPSGRNAIVWASV